MRPHLRSPLTSWVFVHGFLSLLSHVKPGAFATEHSWFKGKGFLMVYFVKAEK